MADKWVEQLFCGRKKKVSNDQVKFAAQTINANFIAHELLVKRVVTFGVDRLVTVSYANNFLVKLIFSLR